MKTFLSDLSADEKIVLEQMRTIVRQADTKVSESVGSIMSSKNCFVYKQEDIFKYGLARTKYHFSFHSMVMYANPTVRAFIEGGPSCLKLQKGCINFTAATDFPLDVFSEFMALSAATDFSPVVAHYKNRK